MKAICHHPVPVRWRSPRQDADRHAIAALRTPVEIPEARRGMEPIDVQVRNNPARCHLHGGVAYDRLTLAGLERGAGDAPARPEDLARALAGPRPDPGPAFRALTPLRASRGIDGFAAGSGEDLPDRILSRRTGGDATAAIRAALGRHVAATFLVDGGDVYVRRTAPAFLPHDLHTVPAPEQPDTIGRRGYGLHVEHARVEALRGYLRIVGHRAPRERVEDVIGDFQRFNSALPGPGGDDLSLWVNEAPWWVENLLAGNEGRGRMYDVDLAAVRTPVGRLRPFVDLGLVGAIDPADWAAVASDLGEALDAFRAAMPDRHTQPPLSWLKGYSDAVAKPALACGPAPIPDEDVEGLAMLAPGGMPR